MHTLNPVKHLSPSPSLFLSLPVSSARRVWCVPHHSPRTACYHSNTGDREQENYRKTEIEWDKVCEREREIRMFTCVLYTLLYLYPLNKMSTHSLLGSFTLGRLGQFYRFGDWSGLFRFWQTLTYSTWQHMYVCTLPTAQRQSNVTQIMVTLLVRQTLAPFTLCNLLPQ